ncbi:MAG: sulfite exporter TauE/SafE family protein [Timaviella obliquedivisa GSE-PSE-MK23-08B]|jgi:cytochrome c biogenesis protein CcdA|nr:sulfite exporter TauE/SafE family protein [Timaviella obliquedivisa GSE-PSE-MK23-08B]
MTTLPLGLALLAGVLTVLSPCVLPILPIIVGRSLQAHPYAPVVLVSGLVSGFAVAGSLLGITASWLTGLANGIRLGAIVLLLVLGVLAIFPHWSDRVFSVLRIQRFQSSASPGLLGEFWLGTQLGFLWTPCAGPILGSILILAAVDHQILGAFRLLLVYGIGAALPLLAIAYGGRTLSRQLLKIRAYSATLQRVGGVIVVITAIAILLGWDVQIQLWLAPFFPNPLL